MQNLSLRFLFTALISLGLLVGLTGTAAAQDGVEKLEVDPVHSNVLFRVKHFGVGYFYGEFVDKKGTIKFDADNPEKSSLELAVDATSVETHNDKRNAHLKGPDFFDTKQFPEIKFESTKFEKVGEDAYKVTGKLTMHGKTKTVSTQVEHVGAGEDPQGNFRRGFHTVFHIKRSDFGVDFMPGAVSDAVKLIIAVEGVRQ